MGRSSRPLHAGLTYHVTARGNGRRAVFFDDADRRHLLMLLDQVVRQRGWFVETYCLMSNHLHLVVRTPEADLSDGMRDMLRRHALRLNARESQTGHVFGQRYHCRVVVRDRHHLELFRYLALNPVRAGLRRTAGEYEWSAHRALLALDPCPPLLDASLAPFDGDRRRYAAFVAEGGSSYLTDLVADGAPSRLRDARAAGFSQREMAHALGVGTSTIGRRLGRAATR